MRIRLIAGLLAAVVLTACTGSPTAPSARVDADPPSFDESTNTTTDTTANRTGGTMGSGT